MRAIKVADGINCRDAILVLLACFVLCGRVFRPSHKAVTQVAMVAAFLVLSTEWGGEQSEAGLLLGSL